MNGILLEKRGSEVEREEFRKIVDDYSRKIMALALNILHNREDAEDACQEAFVRAYRNFDHFDREKDFRCWLYTIVYNCCLDQLRKRRRFRNFFQKAKREPLRFPPVSNPSQSESVAVIAENLLKKLSPKERLTLFLWAEQGCTSEEIGNILNCSSSTARVNLYKARKKIKSLLERENVSLQNY